MPTLTDYFGVPLECRIHGESWRPFLEEDAERETVLYGWFGHTVNVTDGRCTYLRAPARDHNRPLYRTLLNAATIARHCPTWLTAGAELGWFLPYTQCPVIRARAARPRSDRWGDTLLFDIASGHGQRCNLAETEREADYRRLLVRTMERIDAPVWQYERLGNGRRDR